jgi:hypothetical protein
MRVQLRLFACELHPPTKEKELEMPVKLCAFDHLEKNKRPIYLLEQKNEGFYLQFEQYQYFEGPSKYRERSSPLTPRSVPNFPSPKSTAQCNETPLLKGCFVTTYRTVSLSRWLFADVFVPHRRIGLNVFGQKGKTFVGIQVDYFDPERAKPMDTALKVTTFSDDDFVESELANKTAAIPAWR